MIVEYLRYEVEEGQGDAFVAAYERAADPLLSSPYSLSIDLARCVEEPNIFIVRIEWTSADDHLKGFRGSDEFKAFFAEVRSLTGAIKEMRHYERLMARSE